MPTSPDIIGIVKQLQEPETNPHLRINRLVSDIAYLRLP